MKAVSVRFRVDLSAACAIGPGKVALLEAIATSGSLSQAARDLDMSYRRAWLLLAGLNASFRDPVVTLTKGGRRVYLNRTDRTNLYLGYRQTDPLNSKAVSLSLGYQLSHKYYLSTNVTYDFGLQAALSNSLLLTRVGTDLTVSAGFTYTAFVNSFGFQFLVVPNLAAALGGGRYNSPVGSQSMGNRR